MTSPRNRSSAPSRLRAQHRNITTTRWRRVYCCCCRCILHLQQYSRRLNFFVFFYGFRWMAWKMKFAVSVLWVSDMSLKRISNLGTAVKMWTGSSAAPHLLVLDRYWASRFTSHDCTMIFCSWIKCFLPVSLLPSPQKGGEKIHKL